MHLKPILHPVSHNSLPIATNSSSFYLPVDSLKYSEVTHLLSKLQESITQCPPKVIGTIISANSLKLKLVPNLFLISRSQPIFAIPLVCFSTVSEVRVSMLRVLRMSSYLPFPGIHLLKSLQAAMISPAVFSLNLILS